MTIYCSLACTKTVLLKHRNGGSEQLSIAGEGRVKILSQVLAFPKPVNFPKHSATPYLFHRHVLGLCHAVPGRMLGIGDADFRFQEQ